MDNRAKTVDSLTTEEKLHLSVLLGTKKVSKQVEESFTGKITFDRDAISLMGEVVWHKLQELGLDLEHFSKHAKRTTIKAPDVLLLARRNPTLRDHLIKMVKVEEKSRKRKSDGASDVHADIDIETNAAESNDALPKEDLNTSVVIDDDDFMAFADDI